MSESGSAKPARTRPRRPRAAKEPTPPKPTLAAATVPDAVPMVGPEALERATELGYFGHNPMAYAIPNEHYALTTGPDGVSADLERAAAARLLAESLDPSDRKAS